jgi:PKD repeat protein
MLGFPANDPLTPGGCSPVAKFKFNCTALGCSFDGSSSTDDLGIVTYAWAFGDGGTASGVTPSSHSYGSTGTYSATLTVTDGNGLTGSLTKKLNVTSAAAAPAEGYFTVDPCRVLDTRNTTILISSVPRTVQVTGLCNIPATAKAVSVTVTSVTPNGPGFLLLQPGNLPPFPYADISSTLNFEPSIPVRANNAIARLATDGSGTLDAHAFVAPPSGTGQVHLILDVTGYFSEDTSAPAGAQGPFGFQTVTPCRLFDTRASTPLSAGVPRNFNVQGVCGIPSGAAAAAVNLAAISPSAGGFLTLYPSTLSAPPLVSNANFIAGTTVVTANGARLPLGPSTPDISAVYGSGGGATVHLVLDAQGYFTTSAPLRYHPMTPCRLADTRFADLGAPAFASGETREIQVRGNCGIPASAKAAAVNLVAVGPTGGGYLAAWAAGTAYPGTSNLNYDTVQGTVGNGAIVPLGTGANEMSLVAGGTGVHVIVDVFGYFD